MHCLQQCPGLRELKQRPFFFINLARSRTESALNFSLFIFFWFSLQHSHVVVNDVARFEWNFRKCRVLEGFLPMVDSACYVAALRECFLLSVMFFTSRNRWGSLPGRNLHLLLVSLTRLREHGHVKSDDHFRIWSTGCCMLYLSLRLWFRMRSKTLMHLFFTYDLRYWSFFLSVIYLLIVFDPIYYSKKDFQST